MTIIMMEKERLSWLPPPPPALGFRNSAKMVPALSWAALEHGLPAIHDK